MSEEKIGIHIKTYDEWLKYYENATKEQVIEDLTRDVQYFADGSGAEADLDDTLYDLIKADLVEKVDDNNGK